MTPESAGSVVAALLLALIALAAAGPAAGDASIDSAATADAAFEAGVWLTREGRFDQAMVQFLAAEAAGDRSARLYFNLGVVHYRLGHYEQARVAFARAALDPETEDLANYNRGLVALAMDDRAQAARWFEQVRGGAQEPSLRALAQRALDRVHGRTSGGPDSRSRGALSVLRGWDSNVVVPVGTLGDLPTSRRDEFVEARVVWSDALGDRVEGLGYRLSGLGIEHDKVHEADVAAAEAAIDWRGPLLLEGAVGMLAVDDKGYQRTLDVRMQVPVVEMDWARLDLEGGWSRFDPLDDRAADLEGSRYSYGASMSAGARALSLSVGYQHLINDRFASALSPDQDRYRARLRLEVDRWTGRLWGRYTESDYPSARSDDAGDWGLDVAYRLHRHWDVLIEASRLRNRSTDARFDYTSERIYAGLRVRI